MWAPRYPRGFSISPRRLREWADVHGQLCEAVREMHWKVNETPATPDLLHQALRNRLGAHVTQKGSMVSSDRLRFDFSQPVALTADDIAAVEAEVNAEIRANQPVVTRLMSSDDAIAALWRDVLGGPVADRFARWQAPHARWAPGPWCGITRLC